MKPGGPQSIRWPVLDKNSKERFLKEQPRPSNTAVSLSFSTTHFLFPIWNRYFYFFGLTKILIQNRRFFLGRAKKRLTVSLFLWFAVFSYGYINPTVKIPWLWSPQFVVSLYITILKKSISAFHCRICRTDQIELCKKLFMCFGLRSSWQSIFNLSLTPVKTLVQIVFISPSKSN